MSILAATKRFKSFFRRAPKQGELLEIEQGPECCFVVGELDGVMYKANGEKQTSLHRFNKNDRPLLCVSFDGRQIYTIKGSYRFTERGFEG